MESQAAVVASALATLADFADRAAAAIGRWLLGWPFLGSAAAGRGPVSRSR
jgi:hypothetical protein